MTNTLWKAVAVVALVLAIGATYLAWPPAWTMTQTLGSAGLKLAENYDPYLKYNGGLYTNLPSVFGLNASQLNRLNFGNCQIQSAANTIAASTTATVDCVLAAGTAPGTALTGVTAADIVSVSQSTTTPSTFEGVELRGSSASSTPGYITVLLYNGTGTTFTWTAAASSSYQYMVMH